MGVHHVSGEEDVLWTTRGAFRAAPEGRGVGEVGGGVIAGEEGAEGGGQSSKGGGRES